MTRERATEEYPEAGSPCNLCGTNPAGFMGVVRRRIRSRRDISGLNMIGDALNPETPGPPSTGVARRDASLLQNEDEMVESRGALIKADADTCLTY